VVILIALKKLNKKHAHNTQYSHEMLDICATETHSTAMRCWIYVPQKHTVQPWDAGYMCHRNSLAQILTQLPRQIKNRYTRHTIKPKINRTKN